MEMRRRPATSKDGDDDDNDEDGNRRSTANSRRQRGRGGASTRRDRSNTILSPRFVICICIVFIGAGFLQNHYLKSRQQDPLSGSGHLPLPKFVRDMQQIITRKGAVQLKQKQQPQPVQPEEDEAADNVNNNEEADEEANPEDDDKFKEDSRDNDGSSRTGKSSLLSPAEDEGLERDKDGIRYHLIFSTDCSPYQHWQSYLVYFSAMLVRQPGHVTRIASGCDEEASQLMTAWFETQIRHMSPKRFHLQLTPHFSSVMDANGKDTGEDYKFFNKPFGLKYWMEHSPELQFQDGSFPSSVHEDIVILIDPDMGLLRPITRDFTSDTDNFIAPRRRDHIVTRVVGPGKPAAQVYGFGTQWTRLDLAKITGTPNSPAIKLSQQDGGLYYPVGPPYLATVPDMYQIALKWTEFVPGVFAQYPHLLAEMFAFCIAAAHLELRHQLISSLMVSDVASGLEEGWALLDDLPLDQVCRRAKSLVQYPANTSAVPNVVHMCQRYGLGADWFFSKRAIPADKVYECLSPLFQEPPDDLATKYDFKKLPPGNQRKNVDQKEARRMTFMLCYLYRLLNEASTFYKQNACESGTANFEKTQNLVQYMKDKKDKKQ